MTNNIWQEIPLCPNATTDSIFTERIDMPIIQLVIRGSLDGAKVSFASSINGVDYDNLVSPDAIQYFSVEGAIAELKFRATQYLRVTISNAGDNTNVSVIAQYSRNDVFGNYNL